MSPETLKLVLDALDAMHRGRLHSGPAMTEWDFKAIAGVQAERIRQALAATPAGPSEREAFQCPSCGAAIKAPAPTDKESK